jgi:hypothetical protein
VVCPHQRRLHYLIKKSSDTKRFRVPVKPANGLLTVDANIVALLGVFRCLGVFTPLEAAALHPAFQDPSRRECGAVQVRVFRSWVLAGFLLFWVLPIRTLPLRSKSLPKPSQTYNPFLPFPLSLGLILQLSCRGDFYP